MSVMVCSGCEAPLGNRRAHTRYCDQACRQKGARDRRAAARAAAKRDGAQNPAVTVSGGSSTAGAAADGHSWPSLVVAALRGDPALAGHAETWERRLRERGELR